MDTFSTTIPSITENTGFSVHLCVCCDLWLWLLSCKIAGLLKVNSYIRIGTVSYVCVFSVSYQILKCLSFHSTHGQWTLKEFNYPINPLVSSLYTSTSISQILEWVWGWITWFLHLGTWRLIVRYIELQITAYG
jgi:hypothetical protein